MCRRVEQILERTEFPVRSPRGAVSTLPRGRLGLRGASGSPRRPRSGLCRSRRPVSRLQRDESAAAAARTRVSHPSARAAVLSDDGQWTPYAPTPVRKPTPGIPVWTLAQDQHRRECQLRPYGNDGRWGMEVQIRHNGELLVGKRFDSGEARASAVPEHHPVRDQRHHPRSQPR